MRHNTSPPGQRARSPVAKQSAVLATPHEAELFQRWLHLPVVTEESELVINSTATSSSCSLVEPGFDTSDAATFPEHLTESERDALRPIVWRRVAGQLLVPSQSYGRLVKGCLCHSTWFAGALAAISTQQQLLLNLIVSDDHADQGLYTFRFFKHGAWRQVVVDNRLPCMELQQRLAYTSSGTPQELWPSLVEKAYARLHGGYAALACGCVADALVDLTGGIVETISTAAGLESEGSVWLAIMQALTAGNLAVCMAERADADSPAGADADACGMHASARCAGFDAVPGVAGLLADSPYSILAAKVLPSGQKLLRLHNPWAPEGVWEGAWGPDAPEWGSEEGQAALAADPAMEEGMQDTATFWCSFWDFMQVFSTVHLLQLPSSRWTAATAVSGWSGAFAAEFLDTQQEQHSSSMQPLLPDSIQGAGHSQDEAQADASGQSAGTCSPTRERQHSQQQTQTHNARQQCRQVSPECLSWAARPQFRLVAEATCEVVLTLQQQDQCLTAKGPQPPPWQQQEQQAPGPLHIGLRVCHPAAGSSSSALNGKALAAAGLRRPGTSMMLTRPVCPGSRAGTAAGRARSRSLSPRRPGTAPAAAAVEEEACANGSLRVWVPGQHPAVADSGLSSSRDVVVRFVAEGGKDYVVLPYTRSARDAGPFVLRAWAPCSAVQLEQLPSPYSLTQGGRWLGSSAGGSRGYTTWPSNPHFLITSRREATALLCLQRPDVCNSLMPQPFERSGCIGLTVCQPGGAVPARPGTPAAVAAQSQVAAAAAATAAGAKVVGATDHGSMARTALLLQLQPDTPYVLVPDTQEPGVEVPFELLLLSNRPLELLQLPRQCTLRLPGSWGEGTSGGSNLHSSWLNNPAFTLQLERKTRCKINLSRTAGWRRNQPLGEMIGLSVHTIPTAATATQHQQGSPQRQSQSQQHHKQPANSLTMLKQHQLQEAAFVPMQTCEVEWELPGGVPLLLVPCTYAPGVTGNFTLSVTTSGSAVSCEAVPGGLAAFLTATGARVTRPTQH